MVEETGTELALLAGEYQAQAVRLAKLAKGPAGINPRFASVSANCFTIAEGLRRAAGASQKAG